MKDETEKIIKLACRIGELEAVIQIAMVEITKYGDTTPGGMIAHDLLKKVLEPR